MTAYELSAEQVRRLKRVLAQERTGSGKPLTPSARTAITALVQAPDIHTWENACHLVIWPRPRMGKTVWLAMCDLTPSFPRTGQVTDEHNNLIRDWELPPEWSEPFNRPFVRSQLLQAMEEAIHDGHTQVVEQGYQDA